MRRPDPRVGFLLVGALLAPGCLAPSYRIPGAELARLATLPPEGRGQAVRVVQELAASDVAAAPPVADDTPIVIVPVVRVDGRAGGGVPGGAAPPPSPLRDHRRPSPAAPRGIGGGGGGGGGRSGGKAADAKDAAIAMLVVAVTAVVAVAAVEGARFDGWAALHPMFPLHLVGRDGQEAVVPLAQLDQEAAAWADHAVVRGAEGPLALGARAPLAREGATYGVYLGGGTLRGAAGDAGVGFASTIQLGYFPTQAVGLLGSAALGWRDDARGGTLYDSRLSAELDALPLVAGPLHLGLYGGVGVARRFEDGVAGGDKSGPALSGGAILQLDVNTRLALTARLGLAQAHGERQSDAVFGLAVY